MFNFTIRLYQGQGTCLADVSSITISGITIIKKDSKHQKPFIVKGNCKKFGYSAEVKGKLFSAGGSIAYPCITFRGEYVDIEVKDFPRYPAFCQDYIAARSCLQGWGYTNYLNKGFPNWLLYRRIEILTKF